MRATLLNSIRVTVVALALAGGCSSSPDGGGSGITADNYVGTWSFQSGSSIVPNCTGIAINTVDLTGDMVTITKVDSTHIALMIGGAASGGGAVPVMCDVTFTVNGSTAKANGGSSCAINDNGTAVTVNITDWTLTLSGNQLATMMSGTASVLIVSCTPTSSGTLVRSGSDAG
jgi:hypothetical protein